VHTWLSPFYFLYIGVGQDIWDKTQVLLGTSWGMHLRTLWELKNPLGTHSETRKKTNKK